MNLDGHYDILFPVEEFVGVLVFADDDCVDVFLVGEQILNDFLFPDIGFCDVEGSQMGGSADEVSELMDGDGCFLQGKGL